MKWELLCKCSADDESDDEKVVRNKFGLKFCYFVSLSDHFFKSQEVRIETKRQRLEYLFRL